MRLFRERRASICMRGEQGAFEEQAAVGAEDALQAPGASRADFCQKHPEEGGDVWNQLEC